MKKINYFLKNYHILRINEKIQLMPYIINDVQKIIEINFKLKKENKLLNNENEKLKLINIFLKTKLINN